MSRTDTLAANIRDAWNAASDDQISRGRAWYTVAHDIAELIGNGDARIGAGIISALSPRMQWDRNVRTAIDAVNGRPIKAMGASVRKAEAILNGADPESVLPMTAKTGNFYLNMVDPTDPTAITIDCWAYRVATRDWTRPGTKVTSRLQRSCRRLPHGCQRARRARQRRASGYVELGARDCALRFNL